MNTPISTALSATKDPSTEARDMVPFELAQLAAILSLHKHGSLPQNHFAAAKALLADARDFLTPSTLTEHQLHRSIGLALYTFKEISEESLLGSRYSIDYIRRLVKRASGNSWRPIEEILKSGGLDDSEFKQLLRFHRELKRQDLERKSKGWTRPDDPMTKLQS